MKAIWNHEIIAESNHTIYLENNYYFPMNAIKEEYFVPSTTKTTCFWKGEASYFTIVVNGNENKDAAWFYSRPFPEAKNIKNYVAFWKGVEIEK